MPRQPRRRVASFPAASSVTIAHVADAAGVSTATVSRVLSGAGSVNPELAERVRAAVERLDYRPNDAARRLASGRHRNIAVTIPDAANPYFFEVVKAILTSARDDGYRVLIADSQGEPDEELAVALGLLGQVDGLVLLSSRIDADGLRTLARQPVPVVLANRVEIGVEMPMIAVDNFTAMTAICGHLAELGHRRVAYLGGSPLAWQNEERWRAVAHARAFGIDAVRLEGDGTIEAGRAAVDRALDPALDHDPTALICFNDLTALGAMSRLRELGLSTPGDVSVTGFDDIDLARWAETPVTTAVSPKRELGELLWRTIDPRTDEPRRITTTLSAPLVVRQSTGPVRRN